MVGCRRFAVVLVLNLLVDAFALPADVTRMRRGYADNELDSGEQLLGEAAPAKAVADSVATASSNEIKTNDPLDNGPPPSPEVIQTIFGNPNVPETPKEDASSSTLPPIPEKDIEEDKKEDDSSSSSSDDDDEDFEFEAMETSPTIGVGSNIFSLLSLANSLFGGSSGGATILVQRMMRDFVKQYLKGGFTFSPEELLRRKRDTNDNEIETDHTDLTILKPPQARLERETEESNSSETEENSSIESLEGDDNDDGEKEKLDPNDVDKNDDDDSNDDSEDDDDDEPPGGGDGEGGGILGLLAGLSGGEDGQSDLGSLLAAVSGIVVNLSGDGIDVNALIASGIGLFVGLLSEGEENPGAVIASYLLTSLDTLSGGGSKNNGNFFGAFLSKLIKGTSAGGDPDADSEENGNGMKMTDSAGFLLSFLMGLLGDMSKGSSNPHPW